MALPPLLSHPTPAQTRSSAAITSSVYHDHLSNCSGNLQLLTWRKFSSNLGSRSVHVSSAKRRSGIVASSQPQNNRVVTTGDGLKKSQVSSTGVGRQTSTTAAPPPPPFPPPQNQFGSPLIWIGVGVGISIAFSWVAKKAQSYAMQQALKTMMQQTGQAGSPFSAGPGNNPFAAQNPNLFTGQNPFAGMPPGSFPFPPPTGSATSAASATIDVQPSVATSPQASPQTEVQVEEKPTETKKPAFTDVDQSILTKEEPKFQEQQTQSSEQPKPSFSDAEVVGSTGSFAGANNFGSQTSTSENGKGKSFISIEMLETMLDDPKIQQMVFPYLPEEMRDPVTFKRMIQFPPVRQQLQEALNNMGGEDGMDMLKYMNSDVVKQQFDQIGLTPEEVVGKILASPDIAASLQNPKVVEAIMDCSQNPLNITKYQNDPEVMNALMKIAELFPGASGSP